MRFGAIDDPDTARVVHGVVSGISFYGNCLGLPNIGGETWFDHGNLMAANLKVAAGMIARIKPIAGKRKAAAAESDDEA